MDAEVPAAVSEGEIRKEIADRLEQLPVEEQARVPEFVRQQCGEPIRGEPGVNLLKYAGWLDPVSAEEMRQAIEEEFEQVDPSEW